MAKIQITEGKWTKECTTELNLTEAQARSPEAGYDKVITYAEKRYLMTFLVSGAVDSRFTAPGDTVQYKTRIPKVPEGELIDGKAWKYTIMGRIQKNVEIIGTAAIGTPTTGSSASGGFFTIKLRDNYLQPDMNAIFYNGKMARVMGIPRNDGGAGWIYNFQCYPGHTFSWATWIGIQPGAKTLFGGFTTHGERSLRGYGRAHYPDQFIQHMTIQRKGAAITGDANANRVLWYAMANKGGGSSRGWLYWIEAQVRAQFLLEDEFQKWWAPSTMKDSDGNLLSTASMSDPETGFPITAGDGLIPQIRGANDLEASGSNGEAMWDDFADMIGALKKKSNTYGGHLYYCITGTDGIQNVYNQATTNGRATYNLTQMITNTNEIGGKNVRIGFKFDGININGDTIIFVENPMMDDEMRFPKKLSNGKLAMSSTYYLLDQGKNESGRPNIEMRTRGREGVNRNMVYFYDNGMTGEGKPMNSIDGKEFQMLKENMLVIYNTKSCGIIEPGTTA